MRIGEFSKRMGITPRTVRIYEDMGLVGSTQRSYGIRYYSEEDIDRFKLALRLKVLKVPLVEIKRLAEIQNLVAAGEVQQVPDLLLLLDGHLADIRLKISNLKSLELDIEDFLGCMLNKCTAFQGDKRPDGCNGVGESGC